jgi:hypothetical protein
MTRTEQDMADLVCQRASDDQTPQMAAFHGVLPIKTQRRPLPDEGLGGAQIEDQRKLRTPGHEGGCAKDIRFASIFARDDADGEPSHLFRRTTRAVLRSNAHAIAFPQIVRVRNHPPHLSSSPVSNFRICKLQKLQCHECRDCHGCHRTLHPIAPRLAADDTRMLARTPFRAAPSTQLGARPDRPSHAAE